VAFGGLAGQVVNTPNAVLHSFTSPFFSHLAFFIHDSTYWAEAHSWRNLLIISCQSVRNGSKIVCSLAKFYFFVYTTFPV
jgi:hypothetical protein